MVVCILLWYNEWECIFGTLYTKSKIKNRQVQTEKLLEMGIQMLIQIKRMQTWKQSDWPFVRAKIDLFAFFLIIFL